MAHPGSVKKEPGGSGNPTGHNRLRRFGALVTTGLAIVALSACTNAEAQPEQPRPSASATQYPGEVPPPDSSGTEEGDNDTNPEDPQTQGEFESIPSGLEVNYEAFETWDKAEGPTANDLKRDEAWRDAREKRGEARYTQREISDEFFNSNGIKYRSQRQGYASAGINVFANDTDKVEFLKTDPEGFRDMLLEKERMVMALNQDDTDPRNQDVAKKLAEAITIKGSPAHTELLQRMEEARQGVISAEEAVMTDMKVLRYSQKVTIDKNYIIEFTTTRYGKEVKVTQLFRKSDSHDLRSASTAYTYKDQEEQTMIDVRRDGGPMIEADQ